MVCYTYSNFFIQNVLCNTFLSVFCGRLLALNLDTIFCDSSLSKLCLAILKRFKDQLRCIVELVRVTIHNVCADRSHHTVLFFIEILKKSHDYYHYVF